MLVLGLSGGHDANWCVVQDGRILGAFEKERFTRRKHDDGDVLPFLERTLAFLGVSLDEIDLIATSEPASPGTGPGTRHLEGKRYVRPDEWKWQKVDLLGRTFPCVSVPHHLAHAAYAYYTSGFRDSAVISWDAGGEHDNPTADTATAISSWARGRLKSLVAVDGSDLGSLWSVYSHAIFGDWFAAGKLMGLAALGTDRLVEAMQARYLLSLDGQLDGAFTIRDSWTEGDAPAFHQSGADWREPRSQDIAYGIQTLTTRAGLSVARAVRSLYRHDRLAVSGGVSLNGYLCTELKRSAGFKEVFVPPAVYDGGISVGCALFALHHVTEVPPPIGGCGPLDMIGMSYSASNEEESLRASGLNVCRMEKDEVIGIVAAALSRGEIVAWYEGRSEHGPRALGARSILSSSADVHVRERLNNQIKFREPFRPVAPVVLEEDASHYFKLDWLSPYMMYIVEGRDHAAVAAPAAFHADRTARLQTVASNASLGRIAKHVGDLTGTPIIINTSLNVREPIVETPSEAISVFQRVPIDLLFLDGLLVSHP